MAESNATGGRLRVEVVRSWQEPKSRKAFPQDQQQSF